MAPVWEILLQYLQVCSLEKLLNWSLEGCGILALANISLRKKGSSVRDQEVLSLNSWWH